MKTLIFAVLIVTFAASFLLPCGVTDYDWPAGASQVVFTDGDRFFFDAGSALVMAETVDQNGIKILGHFRPTSVPIRHVAVNDSLALVDDRDGLSVLDLNQEGLPVKIGHVAITGWTQDISISGQVSAVFWWASDFATYLIQKIALVNLADPSQPSVMAEIEIDGSRSGSIEMIPGWLFYMLTDRLYVYDINVPANPILAAEIELPVATRMLTVYDTTMVVEAGGELLFWDLSVPTSPHVLASYQPAAFVNQAVRTGDVLLLAAENAFEVVDLSSPEPARIALIEDVFDGKTIDMAATADDCLVLNGTYSRGYLNHLTIDISEPSMPKVSLPTLRPNRVTDMTVVPGRIATLTKNALWLHDKQPDGSYLERLTDESGGNHVDVRNGLAFVTEQYQDYSGSPDRGYYQLRVIDLEANDGEQVLGVIDVEPYDDDYTFDSLQVVGDGWVAVGLDGGSPSRLDIIDVSDPSQPKLRHSIPFRSVDGIAATGDLVFVLTSNGLVIVDVSDPLSARRVGSLDFGDDPILSFSDLAAWGRYVFIGGLKNLLAVDVAIPSQPALIGETLYHGSFLPMGASHGYVFINEGDRVVVFDVKDAHNPRIVQTIEALPCSENKQRILSTVHGDLLVQGGPSCGVQALDITGCIDFEAPPAVNFTVSPSFPKPRTPVQFRNYTTGDPTEWSWSFGDGATAAVAEPEHVYEEAGTYIVSLTASNSYGSSIGSMTVEVGGDTVTPVADFSWRGSFIRYPVTFFDDSSEQPRDWLWDFGDGYSSKLSDASHYFSLAGDYEVTLTVSNNAGSSSITKTVTIEPLESSGFGSWRDIDEVVAATASTPGRYETRWRTDLTIFNPSDRVLGFEAIYFPRDRHDNDWEAPNVWINLLPWQTLTFDDSVATLFGLDDTAGALILEDLKQGLVTSRTFTGEIEGGTFGQAVPSRDMSLVSGETSSQVLMELRQNSKYRSNAGFVNLTKWSRRFQVEARTAAGEPVGTLVIDTGGPYGFVQINNILKEFETDLEQGYLVISAPPDEIQAYTSVIDNRTGDAVFVAAEPISEIPSPTRSVIPAMASVDGANMSRWQSHLELLNLTGQTATVTLTLLETGGRSTPPDQHQLTIEGGQLRSINDVLTELFGLQTTGAILIESPATMHVTSRTFTVNSEGVSDGTYGQHIPAIPIIEALHEGNSASLLDLREDDEYRSNVGFVNPSPEPAVVKIRALDVQGKQMAETTIELLAWEHRQFNRLLLSMGEIERATLVLTTLQGSVLAYASKIDNQSNDPVFMPAIRHKPELQ